MTTKPALQRYLKEFYTRKRKINAVMKIWKKINLIKIHKQMRNREESNTIQIMGGERVNGGDEGEGIWLMGFIYVYKIVW
jgi:hypothetical protein